MTQTSPSEIINTYPLYKVCTQKVKNGEIQVREVRCPDTQDLMVFLRRIMSPTRLEDLEFFEVHELKKDGTVGIVIGDVNKKWPAAPEVKIGGIITPKPASDLNKELPAVVRPGEPPPRKLPVKQNVAQIVSDLLHMKANEPDEIGRPVNRFKREVA